MPNLYVCEYVRAKLELHQPVLVSVQTRRRAAVYHKLEPALDRGKHAHIALLEALQLQCNFMRALDSFMQQLRVACHYVAHPLVGKALQLVSAQA